MNGQAPLPHGRWYHDSNFAVVLLLCLATGYQAQAATIRYVTNTDTRLQDVIDASVVGDTIMLTAGAYRVAGRVDSGTNVFVLDKNLTITSMSPLPGQQAVIDGQGIMRCAKILSGTVMGVTFANGNANDGVGGGVWCQGWSLLDRCIIRNCYADAYAGGAFVQFGTMRSCLVISNTAGTSGGAGMFMAITGFVCNCTIADNSAIGRGGGIGTSGGTIANCIVFSNSSSLGTLVANWFTNSLNVTFVRCCTTPDAPGPNTLVSDPLLSNDYLIDLNSPCYEQGVVYPWVAGAFDLAGGARVQGTLPDIGAYEAVPEPALISLFMVAAALVCGKGARIVA